MRNKRRSFSPSFKSKVAIEAIKEQSTMQDLASKHKLHANQISKWKAEFLDNASSVFEKESQKKDVVDKSDNLYKIIGELKVENDFLKKVLEK